MHLRTKWSFFVFCQWMTRSHQLCACFLSSTDFGVQFFHLFDLKCILFVMIRVMFHAIVFDIFTFYMVFLHIKSFSKKEIVVTLHNVTNLFFTIFTENEIIQTLRTFYYQPNLLSKWVFTVYFGFFLKSSILAWMHFTTVNLHNNLCLIRSLLENFTDTCQI